MKTIDHGERDKAPLVHYPSLWKALMIFTLLVVTIIIGMFKTTASHASSQTQGNTLTTVTKDNENQLMPEKRLHINDSSDNLISSQGIDGADQATNNSDNETDWQNSGGITFPHSYSKYNSANNSITSGLGSLHNNLEKKYVGKNALKFNIHNSQSVISVGYDKAMNYVYYEKDGNGDWQKEEKPIKIRMYLSDFHFYPNQYWEGTPNVFVAKNFARGLYYNGITSMHVQYAYYDESGNQINLGKDAFLTVHGLDGVATPNGSFLNRSSSGTSRGSSYNSQFRLIPYYYTSTWMADHNDTAADNEKFFNGDNGINKYKSELFDNDYNQYGKFVDWLNGDTGYKSSDSAIKPYSADDSTLEGEVNSGRINSNYSGDRNDSSHSITFPVGSSNQDTFLIGSSAGYGNFSLSTDTSVAKPADENKQQPNTPIQKSVDKKVIHRQGEDLTYTLKGHLPTKTQTYKYWSTQRYQPVYIYNAKKKRTYDEGYYYTVQHRKKTNTHDSYNFSDEVPKDVSITSVSSSGALDASQSGNSVSAHASNSQMLSHSGDGYQITIHAKADKLPQPTANGWNDAPNDHGYYTFSNEAHADYTDNGSSGSDSSNKASTKIKRYQGTIWHYDYDNNEDGDFGFMDHAPDGDGNFSYDGNFDEDQGVIKQDNVYGYENDTKQVNTLGDAYKNDNPQWHYRFAYGDQGSETIKLNDKGDDGDSTTQDFYFPYIVPRSRITNSLITVDTDKSSHGLPFTLDLKGESFLYRDFDDYSGADVTINVSAPNGAVLWSQVKPLSDLLTEGHHAIDWTQLKGNLNLSSAGISDGAKVPLSVQVTSSNPQQIQQDNPDTTTTYGYTADDHQINSKSFDNNNNANYTYPQETLKYDGIDQPRTLSEMLSIHQSRNASGKTGYGLRQGNDLTLEYAGNLNTRQYLDNGTPLNYDFPQPYDQNNSGIDYSSDSRNHTYTIPNQTNDQGTQQEQGGLSDRFNQTNHYKDDYSELDNHEDYNPNNLDSYNQMNSNDRATVDATNGDMPLSYSQYIQPSSFKTTYDFAPRFIERDSGTAFLTKGTNDFLAHNRTNPNYDGIDGGERMYTPYFMPLGQYDTYYAKADDDDAHRLGADYYDIDENRPTDFYGHMFLSAQSPGGTSQDNDELSVQPIISHQQNVKGFSNNDDQWLKDQSGFFSK